LAGTNCGTSMEAVYIGKGTKRKRGTAKVEEEKPIEKEDEAGEKEEQKEKEEVSGEKEADDDGKGKEKESEEQGAQKKAKVTSSDSGLLSFLNDGKWKELLAPEFEKSYFKQIETFLENEKKAHGANNIYPPDADIFNALNSTPFDSVKVVILGQDPYFRRGQAHGMAFSVRKGVTVPPSLSRMYTELEEDPEIKGFKRPKHGCLQEWAQQGVLMINATLTVREGKPNSHEKCGWQTFTDAIIKCLNAHKPGVIYLLWGGFAQKKGKIVDTKKNHVLTAAHPSPMSGNAWKGNRHFSKANRLLKETGQEEINWSLSA